MKVLVIIEHDNETVKQSSFSTITAAKEISDSVEAIVLGQGLDSVINELKKSDHLKKIYKVCELTPAKRHWLPTREAWIKDHLTDKPDNLVIRFSAPMVDQRAPASWPHSSEVVDKDFNCPASQQNNECKDCRMCWNPEIKTIRYHKH